MDFHRKPLAFLIKDFQAVSSYKLNFATSLFGIFLSVTLYFFMSRLFGSTMIPHLKQYGGDYFSFVLIGIAFYDYLGLAMGSLASTISSAQSMGTLEVLLVTPTKISTIILSSSIYRFIWTSIRVCAYIVVGAIGFNLKITGANYGGAFLILVLMIISFSSFGIISASFIMVLKRGDPITWIFSTASMLLGGLYYPIEVLPWWLQKISYILPVTYALEGMRLALLKGYPTKDLGTYIMALVIFGVVMMPISVVSFKYAIKRAKMDGSLTHY
jgi:ABC-2 type transport system permease protein